MAAAGVILALLRRPGLPLCIRGVLRLRLEGRMVKNILSIGIPNGVESTMFHFGRLILTSMVAAMSTSAIVANAVGNVIGQFHIFAAQSIGLGMVTVVSRCVGAGDYAKARFYTRKLMKGMIWTQIAINALCLAVTPLVLWAYHLSPESGRLALILTALHAVMSMVLYPLAFGVCNTLRAAGDARYTMWVSSISMWVLRIFAGYVLGFPFRLGVVGLWSAQVILDWSARAICFGLQYRGRRWEEKALKG